MNNSIGVKCDIFVLGSGVSKDTTGGLAISRYHTGRHTAVGLYGIYRNLSSFPHKNNNQMMLNREYNRGDAMAVIYDSITVIHNKT